jgi:hypothetical protein
MTRDVERECLQRATHNIGNHRTRKPYHLLLSCCCVTERKNTVSDETVEKLGVLFSDQLLLAALDLIDRDCGRCPSSSPVE